MPVHGWIAIAEAVEQIKIEDRKLDMLYRLGGSGLVLSSRNVAGQEECTVDLKPEHVSARRCPQTELGRIVAPVRLCIGRER